MKQKPRNRRSKGGGRRGKVRTMLHQYQPHYMVFAQIPKPPRWETFCHCCFEDIDGPSYFCRRCWHPHHFGCIIQEEPEKYVCQ
eukprot:5907574-Karenia_brevis.AAC.1